MSNRGRDDLNARVRAHLRAHHFRVGDRLPAERDLAAALGVGRTVLRAALDGLQSAGVVERRPQSGTFLTAVPLPHAGRARIALLAPFGGTGGRGHATEPAWLLRVASAFERVVRAAGAQLQMVDQTPRLDERCSAKALAHELAGEGANAVVMLHPFGTRETIACALALLHDRGVHPLIVSARTYPGWASQIYFDGGWGAYGATRHLLERGHRRIGFAGASRGHEWVRERVAGYRQALQAAEVEARAEWLQMPDEGERLSSCDDGEAALEAWLQLPAEQQPTGIVAANDVVALGLWEAARERGVQVPQRLSLVGFDNDPGALLAGLTTLERPSEDLGEAAAQVALERLAQDAREAQTSAVSHRLRPRLIERATVAAPHDG